MATSTKDKILEFIGTRMCPLKVSLYTVIICISTGVTFKRNDFVKGFTVSRATPPPPLYAL